jgi:hypothetical protein
MGVSEPEREPTVVMLRDDQRVVSVGFLKSVAVGYLALLVIVVGGLAILERRDISKRLEADLRQCERVNGLRTAINDNALVLYVATEANIERESKLAQSGPNRETHLRSVRSFRVLQSRYKFRPLTNCLDASTIEDYQPPPARPFTQTQIAPLLRVLAGA